jgi:hypothetical protein
MSTLLAIEENFLNNAEIKAALKLTEIRAQLRNIENGQKKKFAQTLELSKVVAASYEWFTSEDGQRKASEEGINWNAEKFAAAIFGWGKSYFHKVLKASKLDAALIETFNTKCNELEQQRKKAERTLEGLLKFAKAVESNATEGGNSEGEGEGEGEETENSTPSVERVETILTFSVKDFQGVNIAVRVDANLQVKTNNTNEQILAALKSLETLIKSL